MVIEPDESDASHHPVVAAYRVGHHDPFSTVSREAALGRIQRWVSGDPLDPLEAAGDIVGYHNKMARHVPKGMAIW